MVSDYLVKFGPATEELLTHGVGPGLVGKDLERNALAVVIFYGPTPISALCLQQLVDLRWLAFCGLATNGGWQHMGLAAFLVSLATSCCATLQYKSISGNATNNALPFWEKMGCEKSLNNSWLLDNGFADEYIATRMALGIQVSDDMGTGFFIKPKANNCKEIWDKVVEKVSRKRAR